MWTLNTEKLTQSVKAKQSQFLKRHIEARMRIFSHKTRVLLPRVFIPSGGHGEATQWEKAAPPLDGSPVYLGPT